jgi:asparagine synthase (glutamine-hydrolysing)
MTTMQASVEARPPFLDHELIEYVYREIPYELKLKWKDSTSKNKAKLVFAEKYSELLDIPKYILKKVALKHLPEEIVFRQKMGFPVPLNNWYSSLKNIAENFLIDAFWLKQGTLQTLTNEIQLDNSGRAGQLLWMFINIELFRKEYFEKKWSW